VSGALVDDRSTLLRLVAPGDKAAAKTLRAAAAKVHTQGVTLPYLVASGDVEGLAAALRDRKLVEAARIGVAEALGRVASEAALAALYAVASATDEDEELRKAAYRAARRGRRYQKKQAASPVVP
jgi:ParB family chromosome partitioning protein